MSKWVEKSERTGRDSTRWRVGGETKVLVEQGPGVVVDVQTFDEWVELTAEQARALAVVLNEAADLADQAMEKA